MENSLSFSIFLNMWVCLPLLPSLSLCICTLDVLWSLSLFTSVCYYVISVRLILLRLPVWPVDIRFLWRVVLSLFSYNPPPLSLLSPLSQCVIYTHTTRKYINMKIHITPNIQRLALLIAWIIIIKHVLNNDPWLLLEQGSRITLKQVIYRKTETVIIINLEIANDNYCIILNIVSKWKYRFYILF